MRTLKSKTKDRNKNYLKSEYEDHIKTEIRSKFTLKFEIGTKK